MTLRIRRQPYTTFGSPPQTYQVHPDEVLGHVIIVASGGSMTQLAGDLNESDDADPAYSRITFTLNPPPDTSTPAGQVQQRLLDLVGSTTVFDLVGVDEATVWDNGDTTAAAPAHTTGHTVFYATAVCGGNGRKVEGANGDEPCTPVVGIMYHELAHAFHNHPVGTLAQDEAVAITDENVLRAAMGLAPRSTTDLRSSCGCPGGDGCCIIATVTSGAPYGPEVNALRAARDHLFRSTAAGERFFAALHREYYAFSIDVARILVQAPVARRAVEADLVRPLIGALAVLRATADGDDDAIAAKDRAALASATALPAAWTGIVAAVRDGCDPGLAPADPALARVHAILAQTLPGAAHVRWAIVEPLGLLDARRACGAQDAPAIAAWWRAAAGRWLEAMPLDALDGLPEPALSRELAELAAHAVPDADARAQLIARWRQRRSS